MEVLVQFLDKLSHGQAQICENRLFKVPNDLEDKGQSTQFSIGHWRGPRYTFCAKMEILGQILVGYGADKLKFVKLDPLKSKMTLKVKVNQPNFQ